MRFRFFIPASLIIATLVLLISLGFWQLDRADEKRAIEDQIARANSGDVELIDSAEFLKECEDCIGKSFITADHFDEFYKDHVMQINAPLWISTLGQASQKGIVDLVPTDGYIKLVTQHIEKEEDGSE